MASTLPRRLIGLMSGTSLDGIDGVVVDFAPASGQPARVLAHQALALPESLRAELLALNQSGGPDELHRAALAARELAEGYAQVVQALLQATGLAAADIAAIGAHGQTVRHRPPLYSLQLNQPAWLAERTGIAVVADFRSRDVAAGGQGAPLVPAFHHQVFGHAGQAVAVVNIGGIANLTALPGDGRVLGLDTGPGNVLLDLWCQRHTGRAYDDAGQWAAQGQVSPTLLARLLDEPYFRATGARSTGRDLFNAGWLEERLAGFDALPAVDVQATLVALSAERIAHEVLAIAWTIGHPGTPGASTGEIAGASTHSPRTLLACGGGALNHTLMQAIERRLPGWHIEDTGCRGWPVFQVEAAAFAWLARQCLMGLPGNEPAVTGAAGPRVLGAVYPA